MIKEITIDEAINVYRKTHTLPTACHLTWLKDKFNPILYSIDKKIVINWACSTCVRNYMIMIIGWNDRQLEEKENNATNKKKNAPRKRTTKQKKKN